MTVVLEPKPEFQSLSAEAVVEALEDPNPANPVVAEIERLIAAYTEDFSRHVERLGYIPPHILHVKVRWPIEAVAMRLTKEALRESVAEKANS
jgi:hypothetical protein